MTFADLMKPYLWLAAVGFAVGFLGYVFAHPAAGAVTVDLPSGWARPASAPVSSTWNFPKAV